MMKRLWGPFFQDPIGFGVVWFSRVCVEVKEHPNRKLARLAGMVYGRL